MLPCGAAIGTVLILLLLRCDREHAVSAADETWRDALLLCLMLTRCVEYSPPNGVLTMVGTLATNKHRTLHHMDTDETMVIYGIRSVIESRFLI